MKIAISVPEVLSVFKKIQEQPEGLFEMIRVGVRENAGQYLPGLMETDPAHFPGREHYERGQGGCQLSLMALIPGISH